MYLPGDDLFQISDKLPRLPGNWFDSVLLLVSSGFFWFVV